MASARTPHNRDRVLWIVVAASTALRLAFAWHFFGFLGGDDAEIIQEAFRVARGLDYAPWNVRNLLLPDLLVAPIVCLGLLLGIRDAGHLSFVATFPFVALASVNVVLVYRLARVWLGEISTARAAAAIYAFHWLPLAYGSTVYPRTAATTCVLLAATWLSETRCDLVRGLAAGAAVAIAFAERYSEAIFLLPLLVVCLSARGPKGPLLRSLGLVGGFTLGAGVTVGLYDLLTWGRPFASLVEFARLTLVERSFSSRVPVQSPVFYLARILFWLTPTLFPALAFAWRERRVRWAWAFLAIPLVMLSLIAHKELRYLQGAIPFLALLGGAGFVRLAQRWGRVPAAVLFVLTIGVEAHGADVLTGKSMAAVASARLLAADPSVRVVALSQSWAYGGQLYLGNRVEVRDVPTPPDPRTLISALAGADRVGLYLADILADPALVAVLGEHGFDDVRIVDTTLSRKRDNGGRNVDSGMEGFHGRP